MQSENGVFAFIPDAPPVLGRAKVCKPRGMQSENGVFAFIPEAPPVLGEPKCASRPGRRLSRCVADGEAVGPAGVALLYSRG